MDTKWKNMNNPKTRRAAPVILWLSMAFIIIAFSNILRFDLGFHYLTENTFLSSQLLRKQSEKVSYLLSGNLGYYRSPKYIKEGHFIDEDQLVFEMEHLAEITPADFIPVYGEDGEIRSIFFYNETYVEGAVIPNEEFKGVESNEYVTGSSASSPYTLLEGAAAETTEYNTSITEDRALNEPGLGASGALSGEPGLRGYDISTSRAVERDLFDMPMMSYQDYIKTFEQRARKRLIDETLEEFRSLQEEFEADGIYYYMTIGGYETGNVSDPDNIMDLPVYTLIRANSSRSYSSTVEGTSLSTRIDNNVWIDGWEKNDFLSFGFDDALTKSMSNTWRTMKVLSSIFLPMLILSVATFIGAVVYLFFFMGKPAVALEPAPRAEGENGPPPEKAPKIPRPFRSPVFSDVAFCVLIFVFFFPIGFYGNQRYHYRYWYTGFYDFSDLLSFSGFIQNFGAGLLFGAIAAMLLYCLLWDAKNRRLVKHSLTYLIIDHFFYALANLSNIMNIGYKVVSARKLKKVKDGIARIREGDFTTPINIRGHGHMAQLAHGLNDISQGFNIAVENRIKSERLKTELISNVSHDIRTPLTSIVTYVDLLKKEGTTREEQLQYLEVLEAKTTRLKVLVDDLFEASKASSGNITAELLPTDIGNVLEQAMGELEDKIQASGLDFRINQPELPVVALVDGKLLWRVMHNLFSNIFKYSMAGSRVYIDLLDGPEYVSLVFKNMSAYELNISSDELMERCTRGDQSRGSEGSGLGLNIAKSLVQIMEGEFSLELDGDLFKAIILLPKE